MSTYTQEEIMKFIKDNDLDIKKLAAIAASLKETDEDKEETEESISVSDTPAKASKAKPALSFELTLCNYPDFVITRTTPATVKQLVVMPSKDSYYVTSVKNGTKTEIKELDSELYAEFTSGMEDIVMPDDFWCKSICKGKRAYENMNKYLHRHDLVSGKTMINMIKDHCAPRLDMGDNYRGYDHNEFEVYSKLPILWKEFHDNPKAKEMMLKSKDTVRHIQEMFGLNNARDYLASLDMSLVDTSSISSGYYYSGYGECKFIGSCLPNCEMDYQAFKEYTLYSAVRFGYARDWRDFFQYWNDVLKMERDLYHKIKVKYPDNLPTYHNQLSYQKVLHKDQINEENFAINSERAKKLAWKMDKDEGRFIFIAPEKPDDFYDEATQQGNCLAGYVQRFTDGEDLIIFMRDKETPEVSEVTIEVMNNGTIHQAYANHNKYLNKEQAVAVHKWAKKFKLIEDYIGFNKDNIKEE